MVKWFARGTGRSLSRMTALGFTLVLGLLLLPLKSQATVRVGNSEIQLAYEMQHTFQYDDSDGDINWVQWRNELRLEWSYEDLVTEGRLFDQLSIPLVKSADFWMMYRGRFDPAYLIRSRYLRLYDNETRRNFAVPENDFRELYLDMGFGEVGPGRLSMRLGRQQIVWGESDLFRSLDIINPLRGDQNGYVGEDFEDFRSPIWAVKFLYDLGTIGPISELGIEPFYTPRWRGMMTDAIINDNWRMERNDRPRNIGVGPHGEPLYVRPDRKWGIRNRYMHPWGVNWEGPNRMRGAQDHFCLTEGCAHDAAGERGTFIFFYEKGTPRFRPHGTRPDRASAGGFRILGKLGMGLDFTLNYLYQRNSLSDTLDYEDIFDREASLAALDAGHAELVTRGDILYNFGIPGQDLETGIRNCIMGRQAAYVNGWDALGYNTNNKPEDDRGGGVDLNTGLPTYPDGRPVPATFCGRTYLRFPWSHIIGFTLTYNDFKYTGAVFRVEESYSTKEARWQYPPFFGPEAPAGSKRLSVPVLRKTITDDGRRYTPVWRSMIGFDLIQSFSSFRGMGWARGLPGDLGTQSTFYTFQLLTEYNFDNLANTFSLFDTHGDRMSRWNWLATFGIAGFYFAGKLEPLIAGGLDFNTNSPVLLVKSFWHGLFGFQKLDIQGGTVLYMGSKNAGSPFGLNQYADRDTAWIRLIYYLL